MCNDFQSFIKKAPFFFLVRNQRFWVTNRRNDISWWLFFTLKSSFHTYNAQKDECQEHFWVSVTGQINFGKNFQSQIFKIKFRNFEKFFFNKKEYFCDSPILENWLCDYDSEEIFWNTEIKFYICTQKNFQVSQNKPKDKKNDMFGTWKVILWIKIFTCLH